MIESSSSSLKNTMRSDRQKTSASFIAARLRASAFSRTAVRFSLVKPTIVALTASESSWVKRSASSTCPVRRGCGTASAFGSSALGS